MSNIKTIDGLQSIHQSQLKLIESNPGGFKEYSRTVSDKDYLIKGHVVEAFLFLSREEAITKLEKDYYFTAGEINISDAFQDIVQRYVQLISDYTGGDITESISIHTDYESLLVNAISANGWQPKWGNKAKLDKLRVPEVQSYLDEYVSFQIKGKREDGTMKQIVNKSILTEGIAAANTAKEEAKYLSDFMGNTRVEPLLEAHYFFKFSVPFVVKSISGTPLFQINLDGEMDYFRVFEKHTLNRDIKTYSGTINEFPASAFTYGYDFQMAFYGLAAQLLYPDKEVRGDILAINCTGGDNLGKSNIVYIPPRKNQKTLTGRVKFDPITCIKIAAIHTLLNVWDRNIFSILIGSQYSEDKTVISPAIYAYTDEEYSKIVRNGNELLTKIDSLLSSLLEKVPSVTENQW